MARPAAPRLAGPAPDRAALHRAALAFLAKFAATEAGLVRVLDRRIARWARQAAGQGAEVGPGLTAARHAARQVAQALAGSGVVDDAAFAAARARSLTRAGRSRRAVAAHLAAKGVAPPLVEAALPDPDQDLATALAYARRRRLGPFRTDPPGTDSPDDAAGSGTPARRELGAMARAGFPQAVAERALRMAPDEAQALVTRLKQGGACP